MRTFAASAAHDELAAHEIFVMKNVNGTLCLIDGDHLDECKAFRLLRPRIGYDLGTQDIADSTEKFFELGLRGRVVKIANVEPSRSDLCFWLRFLLLCDLLNPRGGSGRFLGDGLLGWFPLWLAEESKGDCR